VQSIEQQRTAATAEREQRISENAELVKRHDGSSAGASRERWPRRNPIAEQAQALRQQLAELETQLRSERSALDQLREDRAALSSELAKLRSDLGTPRG
jgi:uncharacterized coiled-coil DUF342 family protein